jgi:glutamate-1-semialdehyde aminotransferase
VKAVSERIALGPQYLMPNEDAIAVAEELARRWGLPMWRFTIEALAASAGLQWRAHPLGPRAGYAFDGRLPRSGTDSHGSHDSELYRLLRLWMVNRGVWEAMEWAGPAISVAATDADVDDYVATLGELAAELTP